jgi:NitT/TauT family transport system ATP-binding protein
VTTDGTPEHDLRQVTDRDTPDGGEQGSPKTVLEVDRVSKYYLPTGSGGAIFRALSDVSLRVAQNEFITVLGPSGCGKTTLLRLVAGFEQPSRGRVIFEGEEIQGPGSDRVVVFQQPGLYPWLSVRDNVAFGLRLGGNRKRGSQGNRVNGSVPSGDDEANWQMASPPHTTSPTWRLWHRARVDWDKVDETIAIVGLKGFEKRPPYELSGGMQQRAALARALVMSPRLLLMDEPFGALDAHTRPAMQEFLLELWDRLRATVIFVTHDVDEAILLGDRVVVMTAGPGKVADEMAVPIPRPRHETVEETDFFRTLRNKAIATLRGGTGVAPPKAQAQGQAPAVPIATGEQDRRNGAPR